MAALKATNVVGTSADAGASFMVLAPTDAAIVKLAVTLGSSGTSRTGALEFIEGTLTTLGDGGPVPLLTTILKFLVTAGAVDAAALVKAGGYTPLEGGRVVLAADGKTLMDFAPEVEDPMLASTDMASNEVMHAHSGVLLPVAVGSVLAGPAMTKAPEKMSAAPNASVEPMASPAFTALKIIAELFLGDPELFDMARVLTGTGVLKVVVNVSKDPTVFAPTNGASRRRVETLGYSGTDNIEAYDLIVTFLGKLGGGRGPHSLVTTILTYHVLPTIQFAAALVVAGPLTTVEARQLLARTNV